VTLVLFDIDGTLTATNAVDAKCYALAFGKVFGFPLPTTDWNVYKHCTDSGIIHEVVEERLGRMAAQEEIDAFERQFVAELEEEWASNPEGFNEIAGAKRILETLAATPGMQPALATGGMRGSATYKLSRIGVNAGDYAGGFANDSTTRHGIARCAIERCEAEPDGQCDIVYVGDGPWDARTSADMGMRFIGIVGDAKRERLEAEGASLFLHDYGDIAAFMGAVVAASVPRPQHA